MDVRQLTLEANDTFNLRAEVLSEINPQFVLIFASPGQGDLAELSRAVAQRFPGAVVAGCTTAGEISSAGVSDQSAVITAIRFSTGTPRLAQTRLADIDDSDAAGQRLGTQLKDSACSAVMLFGQGVGINGSAVVGGLAAQLPAGTPIVGGLAGDDGAFKATQVICGDTVSNDTLVAVALPKGVTIGHGSFGGWKPFGPARKVTRSQANVLYELDGEPALAVYKRYLGDHANGLPASGLLFPFEMLDSDHGSVGLIRTILGIDESNGSLTLAGDIVKDGHLRLMHASNDALIDGAEAAADAAAGMMGGKTSNFCLLVSCIGRKLVMGKRTEEEIEAVSAVFGKNAVLAGFYSYGEISPFLNTTECRLHNQTMTITSLSENV